MSSSHPIRTALLSVSDKTGIVEFAQTLVAQGIQILSTGGTASLLKSSQIPVRDVSDYTDFPEMMHGRIKTLHPKVHGGILARRDELEDQASMRAHGIEGIDLVVINLYPFEQTISRSAAYDECIENIDIGGPAMIRAAAKNHRYVTVVVDPQDYTKIGDTIKSEYGLIGQEMRAECAAKAFAHTGYYDAMIASWFAKQTGDEFPLHYTVPMRRKQLLRYGENPHQSAAFYVGRSRGGTLASARQLHGKELSFNNINDTDAAWSLVCDLPTPAIAIIKHANPCGVATSEHLADAYQHAFACDPQSAYGGIIAANRRVDAATAQAIAKQFAEVVIAPEYEEAALEHLTAKKNLRILRTGELLPQDEAYDVRMISGGYLVQSRDDDPHKPELTHVTERQPSEAQLADMELAFIIAKHVRSNAIVMVKDGATIGIGAGQMSRVDSVRLAAQKAEAAGLSTKGAALASDAFFPFDDNVHHAAEAGIAAIIQPGGSIRDDEVIASANTHRMVMSFTHIRHFKH